MDWKTARHVQLINLNAPLYREHFVDPHYIPRPAYMTLVEYLRGPAPDDLKAYCRSSLAFYRQHKNLAPPWYDKLEAAIR